MSVKFLSITGTAVPPTEPSRTAAFDSDFNIQLDSLRSFVADRLLQHVGPLAWVLVDEALQPLLSHSEAGRLSSPHVIALLRRLHASLPHSIDRDALIGQLRQELLATVL
jgi:hypothetical protein